MRPLLLEVGPGAVGRRGVKQCRRFTNAGRATNWEMGLLREGRIWRGVRWVFPWSTMSDRFHPRSADEYQGHERNQGGADE
ncbi:MAG: hypothetical protein HY348_09025 [Nitrospira defluvii]|nr:hypothetical protein [Nitrospira defluvii]